MSDRISSSGDRWLRIGIGAVLALLAVPVVYAVAIGIVNLPRIGV
jgi:hypothetical protein